ncbi:MAG: EthD domain-containing protein [Actinomycetota bacterium]|nr:EthD domain-containing protein [Actinomycetota bacterium]
MISLTSAIRRRPGMSRAAFFDYLLHVHGGLATAEPGELRRYRQNHVRDAVAGIPGQPCYLVAPDRDNVTEVIFDELPQLFADLSRSYTREVLGPDGANFSDLPTATALVGSIAGSLGTPLESGGKVIAFLRATDGVPLEEFTARWRAAAASVPLSEIGGDSIVHAEVQERVAAGDQVVGYFGGADAPSYQGMISLWFDAADHALDGTGRYLDALAEVDPFFDASRSWRALVDEFVIYEQPA